MDFVHLMQLFTEVSRTIKMAVTLYVYYVYVSAGYLNASVFPFAIARN